MSKNVLMLSASVRGEESLSHQLAQEFLNKAENAVQTDNVVKRNLANNDIALLTGEHVGAFYTAEADKSEAQKKLLEQSDTLIRELKSADVLVVATPMYNFSVPASLKAWIDMVCRVGETFRYTENGPEGLSGVETMVLFVATGGAKVGSEVDFVVPYMTQIAKFLGIKNVEVIAADATAANMDVALDNARTAIAMTGI